MEEIIVSGQRLPEEQPMSIADQLKKMQAQQKQSSQVDLFNSMNAGPTASQKLMMQSQALRAGKPQEEFGP